MVSGQWAVGSWQLAVGSGRIAGRLACHRIAYVSFSSAALLR